MAGERKFITENVRRVLLKEYLKEQVKRAGFGGVDIQRTPMGTRVTLITERPGLVIGRKGSSIKTLTDTIEFEYGFDKPQVEVVEVENANLSAQIMAEKLASALERGWHFRRAGHSTVRRVMENGARGCQVIIAGKLTGQRHRTEKFKEGHIKYCGEPKLQWMEEGYTPAKLKQGIIGVKVQIMHPKAKLPDEVEIMKAEDMPPMPETKEKEPKPETETEAKDEPKGEPAPEPKEKPDGKPMDEPERTEKVPAVKEEKPKGRPKEEPRPKKEAIPKDEPKEKSRPKEEEKPKDEVKTKDEPEDEVKPVEEPKEAPPEDKAPTKPEMKTTDKSDSTDKTKQEKPPAKEERLSAKDDQAKEEAKDGAAEDK
jgi:small subunit ribosomal protein S3